MSTGPPVVTVTKALVGRGCRNMELTTAHSFHATRVCVWERIAVMCGTVSCSHFHANMPYDSYAERLFVNLSIMPKINNPVLKQKPPRDDDVDACVYHFCLHKFLLACMCSLCFGAVLISGPIKLR